MPRSRLLCRCEFFTLNVALPLAFTARLSANTLARVRNVQWHGWPVLEGADGLPAPCGADAAPEGLGLLILTFKQFLLSNRQPGCRFVRCQNLRRWWNLSNFNLSDHWPTPLFPKRFLVHTQQITSSLIA